MKSYLYKIFYFSIPFLIYIAIILAVDPFNYFNIYPVVDTSTKLQTSAKLNYALWEVLRFNETPKENILLGDSRMAGINLTALRENTGIEFYNFAYGGGTLEEIINTFWYADSKVELKTVVIGINFNLYNKYNKRDRVKGAIKVLDNPFLYLFNINTVESFYFNLKVTLSGKNQLIEMPLGTKEEFWRMELEQTAPRYYARYQYPHHYYSQLEKISNYCRNSGIQLKFVIMPEHMDLQKVVYAYGLSDQCRRFKEDLLKLGTVYDFNSIRSIVEDKELFLDPYHIKKKVSTQLVLSVLNQEASAENNSSIKVSN